MLFSEPWVHRLAFQREHAEDALVDAPQWLTADEAFERFTDQVRTPGSPR
jgi:hypothetical protein